MNYYHVKLLNYKKLICRTACNISHLLSKKDKQKYFMHLICMQHMKKNNICIKYLWKETLETDNI